MSPHGIQSWYSSQWKSDAIRNLKKPILQVNGKRVAHHEINAVILRTYNISNIEQLSICTFKLRHKGNVVKCKFFVFSGDGPALLGMVDVEVLGILRITCEVIHNQQTGRKFDSQITWLTGVPICKADTAKDHTLDGWAANQTNVNMLDYFRSSANTEADKEARRSIMQRIHSEFNDVVQELDVVRAHSSWRGSRAAEPTSHYPE